MLTMVLREIGCLQYSIVLLYNENIIDFTELTDRKMILDLYSKRIFLQVYFITSNLGCLHFSYQFCP